MTINAAGTVCTQVVDNVLYVTSSNGFSIGDTIIIESMHGYGEEGIAGSQFDNRFPDNYYLAVPQGLSFIARVVYTHRNRLVLDKAPPSSSVGLLVYKCNAAEIESRIAANATLKLPPGKLAISRPVIINDKDYFTLEGSSTTIFSPRGVPSVSIQVNRCNNSVVTDLTMQGNARSSGYGLIFFNGAYQQGNSWPSALLFNACNSCRVSRVNSVDVWLNSVAFTHCNDCTGLDCHTTMTEGLYQYVQWFYLTHRSTNTTYSRCSVISPTLIAGFADVLSTHTSFIDCFGTNAVAESNGGGQFLFKNLSLTFTANSEINGFSNTNFVLNINTNLGDTTNAVLGGRVENYRATFNGKPYASGHILAGIAVAPAYQNVIIDGLSSVADQDSLCIHSNGYVVNSSSSSTILRGDYSVTGPQMTELLGVIQE